MPGKFPVAAGSGTRPVPGAATPAQAPRPVAAPAPAATPVVIPGSPSGTKPLLKSLPKAPAPAPKGGTQKIDLEAVAPVKPVVAAPRMPMKPPVKLPLQPTVKLQSGIRPAAPLHTDSDGETGEGNTAG